MKLDMTVNVQALVVSLVIGACTATGIYFGVVTRVQALELKGIEHDARFNRTDNDIRQQRQDQKEQLNTIAQDVKEIRGYLLDNAAGSRSDIRRWTK